MDLMTRAGSREALRRVHELWQAVRAAQTHGSESELMRLRIMADQLAALDSELQCWLRAWEPQL